MAALALCAAPGSAAAAEPTASDWAVDAAVFGFAAVGTTTTTCDDDSLYTAGLIQDSLYCSADLGYGYGKPLVVMETEITPTALTVDAEASGITQHYTLANASGDFTAAYSQSVSIDVTTLSEIHLAGTLASDGYSTAHVAVKNSAGTVAEFFPTPQQNPFSFEEVVPVAPGPHTVEITLAAAPYVVDSLTNASGFAEVFLTATWTASQGVGAPIGVRPRPWGRVKNLYR